MDTRYSQLMPYPSLNGAPNLTTGEKVGKSCPWKDTHPVPRKCHPSVRPLVLSRHV